MSAEIEHGTSVYVRDGAEFIKVTVVDVAESDSGDKIYLIQNRNASENWIDANGIYSSNIPAGRKVFPMNDDVVVRERDNYLNGKVGTVLFGGGELIYAVNVGDFSSTDIRWFPSRMIYSLKNR